MLTLLIVKTHSVVTYVLYYKVCTLYYKYIFGSYKNLKQWIKWDTNYRQNNHKNIYQY